MFDPEQVPLHALPTVMQDAIRDVSLKTRAPISMIMSAALASAAMACQQGFRVQRPLASACPLGLYFLQIAESGERKSTVDGLLMRWNKQALDEIRPRFEDERLAAEARLMAWELQMRNARRKLEQQSQEGEEPLATTIDQIKELIRTKPKTPKMPVLTYTDTTPEALVEGMSSCWSGVCLHFDEGGQFFSNRIGSSFGLLNHLWGGSPYTTHRKSKDSHVLDAYSLTAMLWIQPIAFRKFMNQRGEEAMGIGTLPRFLMNMPISTQGNRYKEPYLSLENETSGKCLALDRFTDLLKDLFLESFSFGQRPPVVNLKYHGDAHGAWRTFDNSIEGALSRYQNDPSVRAAYAKLGEQIARISAIFHCLERTPGDLIDSYTLDRAMCVGHWYMNQYIKILGGEGEFTVQADAKKLSDWLNTRAAKRWSIPDPFVDIPLADVYRFGPNGLRKNDRLTPAIQYAESMQMIHYIRSKPAFFRVHRPQGQAFSLVQRVDNIMAAIGQRPPSKCPIDECQPADFAENRKISGYSYTLDVYRSLSDALFWCAMEMLRRHEQVRSSSPP